MQVMDHQHTHVQYNYSISIIGLSFNLIYILHDLIFCIKKFHPKIGFRLGSAILSHCRMTVLFTCFETKS